MNIQRHPKVAVLLATYNGSLFVDAQIASLKENSTPFTLHWLDDHSTDNTREVVRASALSSGIELREWHQAQRQGVPSVFFRLLEYVDADIYLFCDQDDIWQPGKIDATVANLLPDVASPVLCFSDPLTFTDEEPGVFRRFSEIVGATNAVTLKESRLFMAPCAPGHTQGFTRPLREMFLEHKDIARAYAPMHDWWMYILAVASGTCRMISDVPTTLYRRHRNNVSAVLFSRSRRGIGHFVSTWPLQQLLRRAVSQCAAGFVLASATLPAGPKLEGFVALARILATLDRRQSPITLIRLAFRGAMWPNKWVAVQFAAACICSDAPELPFKRFQLSAQGTPQP